MLRRTTGRGLAVTELGFGAAQLGNLYRETTDDEARAAVDAAWDAGIRYFDTAPHYGLGLSERRIGAALAGRPRHEFLISTKVGRLLVPSPESAGRQDDGGFAVPAESRREWNFTRDGILRSFEASLERLRLDHVDIVYLHDPDDHWDVASTEGIGALIELRDQGLVGAIGAGLNQAAMTAEFIRRCDVDIMMVAGRLTLLDHDAVETLLPLAEDRGVAIVAAGVYNSGLLGTSRPSVDAKFEYETAPPQLIAHANAIADRCEAYGVSLPAVAVAYPLRSAAVVSVVLGMRTADQVESNVARYETPIPDELWDDLNAAGLLS